MCASSNASGIEVFVETGAGEGASFSDDDYRAAGADIVPTAADAWAQQMVVKVKEPKEEEFGFLRADLTLFTYLHLAAYPVVAEALIDSRCTALAYETVQLDSGALPLLAPMSEVAGRLAPQMGAHYLERHNGGRGVLMGGAPGVQPAKVVVLGAGNVGWNSAWIAAGMEAEVVLFDKNLDRLRWVDQINKGRIVTLASNRGALERNIADADLVIGAVLVAGGRAPVVVTEDMVRTMKPGAVIVDVAIDQGGCIETIHETTHNDPVYELHGVLHYAVGNMPGAVPHTSTYALTNATLPYQLEVAMHGAAGGVPPRRMRCRTGSTPSPARSPTRPSPSSSARRSSNRSLRSTLTRPCAPTRSAHGNACFRTRPAADHPRRRQLRPAARAATLARRAISGSFATCSATRCCTTTTSSAVLRDKRWHSASEPDPGADGHHQPGVPRAPAGQHPVGRGRRAHPAAPARGTGVLATCRRPPAAVHARGHQRPRRQRGRRRPRRLRRRHLRAVPDPDHLRAARRAEAGLAAVQPVGQRHPGDLLDRRASTSSTSSCAPRTSSTSTPAA